MPQPDYPEYWDYFSGTTFARDVSPKFEKTIGDLANEIAGLRQEIAQMRLEISDLRASQRFGVPPESLE